MFFFIVNLLFCSVNAELEHKINSSKASVSGPHGFSCPTHELMYSLGHVAYRNYELLTYFSLKMSKIWVGRATVNKNITEDGLKENKLSAHVCCREIKNQCCCSPWRFRTSELHHKPL